MPLARDRAYRITYTSHQYNHGNHQDYREAALEDLAKAIELDPFFTRAHFQKGQLQKQLGDICGAWESFVVAEALEGPEGGSARLYTGMVQAMELRVEESGDADLVTRLAESKAKSAAELEPFLQARNEMLQKQKSEAAAEGVFAQIAEVKKAGNKVGCTCM